MPVVALKKVSNIPGGAGNVAANIAGLGASVTLIGVKGIDDAGTALEEALDRHNISPEFLIASKSRPTTAKTRVLVHNQQIARIDDESSDQLTETEESEMASRIKDVIASVDAVVLSDYAKGCLTRSLIADVVAEAKRLGKIVLADPKNRDLTRYDGATMLTPNLAEALLAAGFDRGGEELADEAAERILAATAIGSLLVTLGEHGMKLFRPGVEPVHFPSMARQVFDVTGAGDTVVALLSAALGTGAAVEAAIAFANIGAGIAVEKVGTAVVGKDELRLAIDEFISHPPSEQ